MPRLLHVLNVLGFVLGAVVVVYGGLRFYTQQWLPGLLIALAVVIVGPVEDLLKAWAGRRGATDAEREDLRVAVDRASSAAFLALLLAAMVM
jgi:hypothetical protein